MTRIIATVSTVAALLLAPAPALVASSPHLDLGDLPIIGQILEGASSDDHPATPSPAPSVTVEPSPAPTSTGGAGVGASPTPSPVPSTTVTPAPVGGTTSGGTTSTGTTSSGTPSSGSSSIGSSSTGSSSTGSSSTAPSPGSGPLLEPEEGTTLVFTPGALDPSTLQSSSVSPTPSAGIGGGLVLLGIMGAVVLIALLLSRMWKRSATR